MTHSRRRTGRVALAASSLLAITTFATLAAPATAEVRRAGPGPSPPAPPPPTSARSATRSPARATSTPAAPRSRPTSSGGGRHAGRGDGAVEPARHPRLAPARRRLPGQRPGRPLTRHARGCATTPTSSASTPPTSADLELVSSQPLARSEARAVLFRQDFGGVAPALGGLVTVGVADGQVAYVSSSLARTTGAMPAAMLTPLEGWLKAAADLSVGVAAAQVPSITTTVSDGWTRLTVPGFAQEQQVRLRALPMADGTRPSGPRGQRGRRRRRRRARLHQPGRRRHRRGAGPAQQGRQLRLQRRLHRHRHPRPGAAPSTRSS